MVKEEREGTLPEVGNQRVGKEKTLTVRLSRQGGGRGERAGVKGRKNKFNYASKSLSQAGRDDPEKG